MKVRCIANTAGALPRGVIDERLGYGPDHRFPLTVGAEYVVYAVTTAPGGLWFYLADDDFTSYPVFRPSQLFELVDDRLSSSWRAATRGPVGENDWLFAFEEWAGDPSFYERLVDGEPEAVSVFFRRKEELDEEFAD